MWPAATESQRTHGRYAYPPGSFRSSLIACHMPVSTSLVALSSFASPSFLRGLAAVLVVVHAANVCTADNWAQFRGPNGSGVAADSPSIPDQIGPATNVKWKSSVPRGLSSPCVFNDHIFLTSFSDGQLSALCLSAQDGRVLWQNPIPAKQIEKVHKTSSPANATAVADQERVYFYFASCGLFAFDHAGEQAWHYPTPCSQREPDFPWALSHCRKRSRRRERSLKSV